jgi:hypothetical protein
MEMVRALERDVTSGTISSYDQLLSALQRLYDNYHAYEWQYVVETFQQEAGYPLQSITREQAAVLVEEWQKAAVSIHASILDDSKKEFGHFARIGYGVDLPEAELEADFQAVRGSLDTNAVVQKLTKEGDVISKRAADMHAMIAAAV